ncbi:peptidyl-prolyl cis-trans isomerase [Striga asiatica]|uniref:Peptidyl-prolyl cis-trans isomerase n=1 Tax=Striga asiatica TaxID=4170 RepID=A0A5A7PBC4_STRAF|nr:peptidyl-prolyl cis-trans isomerase [Striga asiatica]
MITEHPSIQNINHNTNITPLLVDIPILNSPPDNNKPEPSESSDPHKNIKPLRPVIINRKPSSENMLVEMEILDQNTPLNINNKRALPEDPTYNPLTSLETKKYAADEGC